MGMAVSLSVHVLAQLPILAFGTDEQKARLLPPMTAGERLGAFALTEPGAGSDAAALALRAERTDDGYAPDRQQDLDHERPRVGGHHRLRDRRPLAWPRGDHRLRRGAPDARASASPAHERKMGIRDSVSAELVFDGASCRRRTAWERREKGSRWPSPRWERAGSALPPSALACARSALEHAGRYALQRTQFGRPIADQEMIQAMLAEAATNVEAARLLTWRAARLRDAGEPINAASSMAKMFASDAAMQVTTDAVQVYGGAGYSRDNPVERLMRDAKGAQIYEGTNQIHRLIVAQHLLDALRRG